jgi:hypothetical protein
MALRVSPEGLGLTPGTGGDVWGVVMDTVMADGAWHCLVVLAEGTTSLYTSGAFGVIGAGADAEVRRAGEALLTTAGAALDLFVRAETDELPAPGQVAIRALTFSGQQVVIAREDELGHGRHPASSVFYAAHDVITQVRLATPR